MQASIGIASLLVTMEQLPQHQHPAMQQRHIVLAHLAAVLCLALQLPRCHGHAYLAVGACQ
jgi:hypothetical protein